jgi:hypothetical protein
LNSFSVGRFLARLVTVIKVRDGVRHAAEKSKGVQRLGKSAWIIIRTMDRLAVIYKK